MGIFSFSTNFDNSSFGLKGFGDRRNLGDYATQGKIADSFDNLNMADVAAEEAPPAGATFFPAYPEGGGAGALDLAADESVLGAAEETLAESAVLEAFGPAGDLIVLGMVAVTVFETFEHAQFSAEERERFNEITAEIGELEQEINGLIQAGRPADSEAAALWDREMSVAVDRMNGLMGQASSLSRDRGINPDLVHQLDGIVEGFNGFMDFRPGGAGTPTIGQIHESVQIEKSVENNLAEHGVQADVYVSVSLDQNGNSVFETNVHIRGTVAGLSPEVRNQLGEIITSGMTAMDNNSGLVVHAGKINITDDNGVVGLSSDGTNTEGGTPLSAQAQTILNDLTNPGSDTYEVDLGNVSTTAGGELRGYAYVSVNNNLESTGSGALPPGGFVGRVRIEFIPGQSPIITFEVDVIAALPDGDNGAGLRGGDILGGIFPTAITAFTNYVAADPRFGDSVTGQISNVAATGPNNIQFNHVQNDQANQDMIRYTGAMMYLVDNDMEFTLNNFARAYNAQELPELGFDEKWESARHDQHRALETDMEERWDAYVETFGADFANQLYSGNMGIFTFDMAGAEEGVIFAPGSVEAQVSNFMMNEFTQTSGSLGRMGAGFMGREFGATPSSMYYVQNLDSWMFSFERN